MNHFTDYFKGRAAVIANKHKKEQVIAPLLQQHLGLAIIVPEQIDTDQFGTFTRDIPRQGTMLDSARAKVQEGLRLTGVDVGIASEGAFGSHPAVPLVSANTEIVVLIDKKHDLEIVGGSVTFKTNHRQHYVTSVDEAFAFAKAIGFPEHGIVVRDHEHDTRHMQKGVTTFEALEEAVSHSLRHLFLRKVFLETDMRANVNPTRMENIKRATEDLIQNALRVCPQCATPGFSVSKKEPGLPCEQCSLRTELTLADVYTCKKCAYSREEVYPDGKETADAGHCGYCNP